MSVFYISNIIEGPNGSLYTVYNLTESYGPLTGSKEQVKALIKEGHTVSGYKLDTMGRLIRDCSFKTCKKTDAEEKLVEYLDHLKGTLTFTPMYFRKEDYYDPSSSPKCKQMMIESIFDPNLLRAVQPLLKEHKVEYVLEVVDRILKERAGRFKYLITFYETYYWDDDDEPDFDARNWFVTSDNSKILDVIRNALDAIYTIYDDEIRLYTMLTGTGDCGRYMGDVNYCYPILKFPNMARKFNRPRIKDLSDKEVIRFFCSEYYFTQYIASESLLKYCASYLEKYWDIKDEVALFEDCVKAAKDLDKFITSLVDDEHMLGIDGYNNPKEYTKNLCEEAKERKVGRKKLDYSDFYPCTYDDYGALIATIAMLGKKNPNNLERVSLNKIRIKPLRLEVVFNYTQNSNGHYVTAVQYLV